MNRFVSLREALLAEEEYDASLADQAYRLFQSEIFTLNLRPGEVIREVDFQRRFGMGRTPIREALLRLASDKLVTIHPRRGTFVSDMNISDLGAVYEVRESLEALVARLAAERVADADRQELADARRGLPDLVRDSDLAHLLTLDRHLHHMVYQLARNEFLKETLQHYLNLSIRLAHGAAERSTVPMLDGLPVTLLGLVPLLEAIEAKRPDEAAAAARRHIVSTERMLRLGI